MPKVKCEYKATIVNGALKPNSEKYAKHMLTAFEGKTGLVTFNTRRKTRSMSQNNYYWGVYLPTFSEHTGHTPEELHEVFKGKYGIKKVVIFKNKAYRTPLTTTEYSSSQFTEYLMRLDAEAGELGLSIPRPEDLDGYMPH